MAIILKCKMCGGNLDVNEGEKVCECEYCGTTQTVPDADNDKKINLFNRANRLRTASEFDKAASVYESIVSEFPEEAEAYWGLCLCKYGIEYVDDPATGKKIPTCHRTSFESIFDDNKFDMALEYSDVIAQRVYRDEAKEIDRLQKAILDIAGKEEPFDVFICYKETAEDGQRTKDSVMAQDIYDALTAKGYKVFFSRITLEDKLGQEYEPYIFSALTSANVMLAIGTNYEYFNAVWVKNEWSRFLDMMKSDKSKTLIPCYADIDAYDMPQEFKHLQGQDMSKVGFIQDLVRGIGKIIPKDEPKTVTIERIVENGNANTASLLKRAFMFLEDSNWSSADEYAEKVLDIDPEYAEAYLVKLMAELNVEIKEDLKNCAQPFDNNNNYNKAYKFGDDALKSDLSDYNKHIRDRNEESRKEGIYSDACHILEFASSEDDCLNAKKKFESIIGYNDSDEKITECENQSDIFYKDNIYFKASQLIEINTVESLNKAIKEFGRISEWKDSYKKIDICNKKIEEIDEEKHRRKEQEKLYRIAAEKKTKYKKMVGIIAGVAAVLVISSAVINIKVIAPANKYNNATALFEKGSYKEASQAFKALGSYKDSIDKSNEALKYFYSEKYSNLDIVSVEQDFEENDVLKIKFGNYVWRVIDIQSNSALIITDEIIEDNNILYDDEIWEKCNSRKYLNETFYNEFSETEKAMIKNTQIVNIGNPEYNIIDGNDTNDNVFLLSIDEANKYFLSDEDRITYYKGEPCNWRLRSVSQLSAARVECGGNVYTDGYGAIGKIGLRPAIYIEL